MRAQTLPAVRGWRWLLGGLLLYRRSPLTFSVIVLAYWMLMVLINSIPVIGQVAAPLLVPAFSVSLMNACRNIEQGSMLQPQVLFSGFSRNLRVLLVLGGVYATVGICILGIVSSIDGGALSHAVVLGERPGEEARSSSEFVLALPAALLLFFPVMMAYWFAPVLVAWNDLSAGKALFFSFVACARNWRAFLAYALVIMVFGAFLRGLLVGFLATLSPDGGQLFFLLIPLLAVLVFLPALYGSFYVCYRDVFISIDQDV